MVSIVTSSIRNVLLLSACALAFTATTSVADTVEPIDLIYVVDPVVELPTDVEVAVEAPTDAVEPIDVLYAVDPVVELPTDVEAEVEVEAPVDVVEPIEVVYYVDPVVEWPTGVETEVEAPTDIIEDKVVEDVNEVPIEWVLRDFDPGIMYSAMGGVGLEDNSDEIASRAAEQAANRTIDNLETALPDTLPQQ